jgi:hypothetical protein
VGIELMRVLSSSELVQTLKGKSWRSAEISRALGVVVVFVFIVVCL